jgi:hypothetical protein
MLWLNMLTFNRSIEQTLALLDPLKLLRKAHQLLSQRLHSFRPVAGGSKRDIPRLPHNGLWPRVEPVDLSP